MFTVWVLVIVLRVSSGTAAVQIEHDTAASCVKAAAIAQKNDAVRAAMCLPADRLRSDVR